MPAGDPCTPAQSRPALGSLAAVIVAATVFGITYGLSAPLIALEMARMGASESLIGLNAAMHAVGVLLIAPFMPRLVARYPANTLICVAVLGNAAVLAAFQWLPAVWIWFVLRLLLGMAAEIVFVLSETWANALADDRIRGRVMACYTASLSCGFAIGPALLAAIGSGHDAYWIGALICVAAAIPVMLPGIRGPARVEEASGSPLRYARMAPVAMSALLLNAGVETAGLSFIVLYAGTMGWSETQGLALVTSLMVGAIVLQLPIGWLADRVDRGRLVRWLALASAVGALTWPWLLDAPWLAHAGVFVWGGLFVGIYTVMLSLVGSRFGGAELVGIYAAMGLAWGLGALLGPTLVGAAMHVSARFGLPFAVAAACALFGVYCALRARQSAAAPV